MPADKFQIEYVSWRTVHLAVALIARRIMEDNYDFNVIYSVVKGGLIPARLLIDLLGTRDLGFIGVRFYTEVGSKKAKPELYLPPTLDVRGKRVLVVDDVSDSGRTLQLVIDELNRYGAELVMSAVIYVKPWSLVMPDYYYMVTDKWIVFPWEIGEAIEHIDPEDVSEESDSHIIRQIKEFFSNVKHKYKS